MSGYAPYHVWNSKFRKEDSTVQHVLLAPEKHRGVFNCSSCVLQAELEFYASQCPEMGSALRSASAPSWASITIAGRSRSRTSRW